LQHEVALSNKVLYDAISIKLGVKAIQGGSAMPMLELIQPFQHYGLGPICSPCVVCGRALLLPPWTIGIQVIDCEACGHKNTKTVMKAQDVPFYPRASVTEFYFFPESDRRVLGMGIRSGAEIDQEKMANPFAYTDTLAILSHR
jgi:hypothetical protein